MQVKVKKLNPDAVIPKYAKLADAGLDLIALTKEDNREQTTYGTGLSIEIPMGYVGLIFPRSSIRQRTMTLSNSVGVIDSGYRGEVRVTFNHVTDRTNLFRELRPFWDFKDAEKVEMVDIVDKAFDHYQVGDKIAQLVIIPIPEIELVESESLSETERGIGGFGSTGK